MMTRPAQRARCRGRLKTCSPHFLEGSRISVPTSRSRVGAPGQGASVGAGLGGIAAYKNASALLSLLLQLPRGQVGYSRANEPD